MYSTVPYIPSSQIPCPGLCLPLPRQLSIAAAMRSEPITTFSVPTFRPPSHVVLQGFTFQLLRGGGRTKAIDTRKMSEDLPPSKLFPSSSSTDVHRTKRTFATRLRTYSCPIDRCQTGYRVTSRAMTGTGSRCATDGLVLQLVQMFFVSLPTSVRVTIYAFHSQKQPPASLAHRPSVAPNKSKTDHMHALRRI